MKSIIIFGGCWIHRKKSNQKSFAKDGFKVIVPYQRQTKEANLKTSLGQLAKLFLFTLHL